MLFVVNRLFVGIQGTLSVELKFLFSVKKGFETDALKIVMA